MAEAVLDAGYVTRDAFDIQVRSLRDRADSDLRVSDARFDRLEALIAGNLAAQQAALSEIKGDVKAINERMNGAEKATNERIDKNLANYEAIASRIEGDVKAISASIQSLQQRRSWDIAWIGIAIAVGTALIQIFSK